MPIIVHVLIVLIPLLLILIRFVLGTIFVVLYALTLTIKGAIEDHRVRKALKQ
jgi:hypothetical protein